MTDNDTANNGRVRDEKISNLREDVLENKKNIKTVADEVINVKIELARLSERMALFQVAQGVFTVLATGLSMYIAYVLQH